MEKGKMVTSVKVNYSLSFCFCWIFFMALQFVGMTSFYPIFHTNMNIEVTDIIK